MKEGDISVIKQRMAYLVMDFVTTAIAFFIFNICRFHILAHYGLIDGDVAMNISAKKLVLEQIFVPMALLAIYALAGFYNHPLMKSRLGIVTNSLCVSFVSTAIIYLTILLNDIGAKRLDYLIILILFVLLSIFVSMGRLLIASHVKRSFEKRGVSQVTLMIGNSRASRKTARLLLEGDRLMKNVVAGYVNIPGEEPVHDESKEWDLDDMADVCKEVHPDQIVIATAHNNEREVMDLLDRLIHLDIPIKIAPDTLSYVTSGIRLGDILGTPFIDLTSPRMSDCQKNLKRVGDILVSALMLLVLSPVYLILAIAVKRSTPGPVIYSQERIGMRQKPFRIYKFRSMQQDAEIGGPQLSHDSDQRITRVGAVMRKYRLDELPQFWNVLKGDMSLVGPRPERDFYIRKIMREAPYYALVFQVRPGITSWGMVKYGYASTVHQMVERSRYDLVYLNNMSIVTDVKILIYTVRTVVTGEGK